MSHFISKNMEILDHKIDRMMPMPESPFAFRDDESFRNLVESILLYGLIDPIIVQPHPKNKDKFEIISGVRRWYACRELGCETISCIVADNMTREEAIIFMVDANLCNRESISPTEKGKAYKIKLDAMKRQGNRSDLEAENTSCPPGTKFRTDEVLAENAEDSARQIQRYIRLTELIPELQQLVDEHRIALGPAVELSYLPEETQRAVYDYYAENEVTPSYSQANQMKKRAAEGTLTPDTLTEILEKPKPNQVETIKLPLDDVRKYRPNYTVPQLQDFIRKACEHYAKYLRNRDRGSR
ncbi:MAG: ParB/RepB/Spo0J family partition protein [Clostridia bacterium]|nr:ParB/RepB/Spo0J family partition protein [Clostridia bacterium]